MLRGLMLVIMTLDHMPLFIRRLTYQPFGFFDAASGFVFLSGFVYGMVYSKYLMDHRLLIRKNFRRVGVIYLYHVGIYLIILSVEFITTVLLKDGPLHPDLQEIHAQPVILLKFLFLLNQPGLFDILPLFIFVLLFSPFIMIGFQQGYARPILAFSFFFWLMFQVPQVQTKYGDIQRALGIQLGYFNIFAWQFLFHIGNYLGFCRTRGTSPVVYRKAYLWIVTLLVAVLFVFKQIGSILGWGITNDFIPNRSHLGAPMLINFLLFVYLVGWISKKVRLKRMNFLSYIGRYSIDVFVFHVFVSFMLMDKAETIRELSYAMQIVLAIILALSLYIPARIKAEIMKQRGLGSIAKKQ